METTHNILFIILIISAILMLIKAIRDDEIYPAITAIWIFLWLVFIIIYILHYAPIWWQKFIQ